MGISYIHQREFNISLCNRQCIILSWGNLDDSDADLMLSSYLHRIHTCCSIHIIWFLMFWPVHGLTNEITSCLLTFAYCLQQDRGKPWQAALQLEDGMICTLKRWHYIDLFGRKGDVLQVPADHKCDSNVTFKWLICTNMVKTDLTHWVTLSQYSHLSGPNCYQFSSQRWKDF